MHILWRDGLQDDDYLQRYCLGGDAAARPGLERISARTRRARSPASRPPTSNGWPTNTARSRPALIRLNYGMQRHGGGGMAVRDHHLPARRHRRLAARRRRRAAQHQQAVSVRRRRAGAARSDSARHAHDQHGAAGRGAARRIARPAGARAVRLQLQSRRRLSRPEPRAARACCARTCSPSSTSSSRPTPPITPTSCCRRRRNWSISTSTAPTATCTCRPTSRRSRRCTRRRATPTCSACWRSGMGFEPELFQMSDEAIGRRRARRHAQAARRAQRALRRPRVRRHHPRPPDAKARSA